MDTDGSQCPENSNSTDCLLRALLQLLKEYREADNAEIDWDPINFAFTVLIGLIAILFAMATILQAIFAAGKGRRRTNRLAIGKWSQKTTSKWDWSEMNFRFTASTPILREESLPAMPERSKTMFHGNEDDFDDELAKAGHENGHPYASAAWLEFFEEVGLHKLGVQAWDGSTREVPADYLPDDLMAAPAYAQVGAVVAAAVTAGVQKLDVDQQNYPILLGRGFQIDFRQHPSLGVIGAYSRYDKENKKARTLSLEQLRSAMQYGRGIIDADMMTMDLSTKAKRRQVIERWRWNQSTHPMLRRPSDVFLLKLDAISETHLPLIVGLFAHVPERVPALFPTATMATSLSLTVLALNGRYWAKACLDKFVQSNILQWPESSDTPVWDNFIWYSALSGTSSTNTRIRKLYLNLDRRENNQFQQVDDKVMKTTLGYQAKTSARINPSAVEGPVGQASEEDKLEDDELEKAKLAHKDTAVIYGHCVVLHMCLRLLREPERLEEWFFETSLRTQESLRCIVLEQLKEVDRWLRDKRELAHIRSTMICNTTIVLSQAEQIARDEPGYVRYLEDEWLRDRSSEGLKHDQDTAPAISLKIMMILWRWLRDFDQDADTRYPDSGRPRNLVDDGFHSPCDSRSPHQQLKDRLDMLFEEYFHYDQPSPFWNSKSYEIYRNAAEDIDDVVIYRCLIMILLFRTAADSSKILESGVPWDKVVPII